MITDRMHAVGISQAELAELAKVSVSTLRKLQHGTGSGYRAAGLARVSASLGWPSDVISRLLGGEPIDLIPLTQPAQPHTVAAMARVPSPTVVTGEVDDEIAAMSGRLHEMTPEQRARVAGYMDAIRDEQT